MMKKSILLFFIAFIFYYNADSQITKGNWMVGGNASFLFTNSNTGSTNSKANNIDIAPDIGYFFIDKLAGGMRLSYNRHYTKFGSPNNNFQKFITYSIGPFVRYYFLPIDQRYNIVVEGSYQYGDDKTVINAYATNTVSNKFIFSGGPVIYFNTSVGIEFLLNYTNSDNNYVEKTKSNSFGVEIGLQIHLEKDKN